MLWTRTDSFQDLVAVRLSGFLIKSRCDKEMVLGQETRNNSKSDISDSTTERRVNNLPPLTSNLFT